MYMHLHVYAYMPTHMRMCNFYTYIYRRIFTYKVYLCTWACVCMYVLFRFQVMLGTYIPVGMYLYKYLCSFLSLNEKLFILLSGQSQWKHSLHRCVAKIYAVFLV